MFRRKKSAFIIILVLIFEFMMLFGALTKNNVNADTGGETPLLSLAIFASTDTTVELVWTSGENNVDAASYDLYRNGEQAINTASFLYTDTGLTPETQYTYYVEAKDADGNVIADSNEVSVTTSGVPPLVAPGIVRNITGTVEADSVELIWDALEDADSYDVEADGVVISLADVQCYSHIGLNPDSAHTYRVRGVNAVGAGEWSEEVVVTIPALSEGLLSGLTLSSGTLSPEFSGDIYSYTANVGYDDNTITVTPVTDDADSTITVSGLAVVSGQESEPIPLEVGNNTIEVQITTKYGEVNTYTVNVTRASSPYLSSTILEFMGRGGYSSHFSIDNDYINYVYTTSVISKATRCSIIPESEDANAIISVNGNIIENFQGLSNISIGLKNIVTVIVTSSIGTDSRTYYYYIFLEKENFFLSDISISSGSLMPMLSNNILSYTANVGLNDSSVTITPTAEYQNSTITVNGMPVVSGQASEPIPLDIGENSINIVLKTQIVRYNTIYDSTTTYNISIFRGIAPAQNLTGTASNNEVYLNWDLLPGADFYELEIDGEIQSVGADTSFEHIILTSGATHTYRVRGVNAVGAGEWSNPIEITILDTVSRITACSTDTDIELTWEQISGADGYDIEIDGAFIYTIQNTFFVHDNLIPDETHVYRIRGKYANSDGSWSETFSFSTLEAPVPAAIVIDGSINDWDEIGSVYSGNGNITNLSAVLSDKRLYVMVNGSDLSSTYRIYIDSDNNYMTGYQNSEWTNCGADFMLENGNAYKYFSVGESFSWQNIGIAEEVLNSKNHELSVNLNFLERASPFSMRIAYIGGENLYYAPEQGNSMIEVTTIITGLSIPQNVKAVALEDSVEILWDAVEESSGYDIEIDGELIENIEANSYVHDALQAGEHHTYRVRAKNTYGRYSVWSLPVISYKADIPGCATGKLLDIVFNAGNIQNPETKIYSVHYDPAQLEVIDLCGATPEAETEAGEITGTDIEILEVSEGRIVFKKTTAVTEGNMLTGALNVIKFKSKLDGQASVTLILQ